MPIVRSLTEWRTRTGRTRRIRLYSSWMNMRGRIKGWQVCGRSRMPIWRGIECGFKDWADFRAWSLAHGYSKTRCSLDRMKSNLGYVKSNLRWVTVLQNSTAANQLGAKRRRELEKQRKPAIPALAYL